VGTTANIAGTTTLAGVTATSITDSGLTSGRVTYAGTAGLLQDSASLTWDGTSLTATKLAGAHNGTVGATTPSTGAFTTLSATGQISGTNTASYQAIFSGWGPLESHSSAGAIVIGGNSTNRGEIHYWYNTSAAPALYIDNTRNSTDGKVVVRLKTSGTAVEAATFNIYGIGLTGATPSSGTGITFPATQSASTDANTLDDYEEGTFLHGISFGGAAVGITYNANYTYGFYTKIGRVVHVLGTIILTSKGSSTGSARITGLPFTSNNTLSSCDSAASLSGVYAITFTNIIEGEIQNGTNTINLNQSTSVGGNTDIADTNFGNTSQLTYTATYFV
jgi:hypothetical protein